MKFCKDCTYFYDNKFCASKECAHPVTGDMQEALVARLQICKGDEQGCYFLAKPEPAPPEPSEYEKIQKQIENINNDVLLLAYVAGWKLEHDRFGNGRIVGPSDFINRMSPTKPWWKFWK